MSDLLSHHLNQIELSRRWRISPRTLERWRWLGEGPQYLKIGGRGVVARTSGKLILGAVCSLQDVINATQVQR